MNPLVDDIGSFPLPLNVDYEKVSRASELARKAAIEGKDLTKDEFVNKNFSILVLDAFRKKITSGLDVPNFPQAPDGIKHVSNALREANEKGSFVVEEQNAILPEVYLINQQAKLFYEEFGKKIQLRVSIFGPLEQYLHEVGTTPYLDVLEGIAETIRRFAKKSILNNKYIETKVVSIDEPSLGHVQTTPEVTRKIFEKAFDFEGATRQIHLHSASCLHDLLSIKNLDVLSFEFAASPSNINMVSKNMIENTDKQIRVGVSRTDIDTIFAELYEKGIPTPTAEQIVEPEDIIRKRFKIAKEKYGERMTFTGPDCGLGGWPTQEAAFLLLKRTVDAVKKAH